MDWIIITAQVLSIIAMMLTVLSMQCRSNRNFFLLQEAAGLLFAAGFFMFGAWSGAFMNVFGVIRPELLRREKIASSKITLIILLFIILVCTVLALFVFHDKWYLVAMSSVAQTVGTCCMWTQNGKTIRYGQLCAVSPLWLIYNSVIPVPSIGGILTETLNIISSSIALYRYRKVGFTQK